MLKTETGYYSVNSKKYISKLQAVLEAQRTGSEVKWHFFDDEFEAADWSIEPPDPLPEIYRRRALQIRNEYDYVIVRCSGGADSSNVLWSFLTNNIHVDEVLADCPMSGLTNWNFNTSDTRVHNYASEFKFAQLPLLQRIASQYPSVKIRLLDPMKEIIAVDPEKWLISGQDTLNPWTYFMSRLDKVPELVTLAESGKRIAVVSGIDKPVLTLGPDKMIYSMFADMPVTDPRPPFTTPYPNVDRVFFYWDPTATEVVIKMSHVAARAIHQPENKHLYKAMIDLPLHHAYQPIAQAMNQVQCLEQILSRSNKGYAISTNNQYNPFTTYERGIVPFIYPSTFDPNVFQTDKMDTNISFFAIQHDWFRILHKNAKATKLMEDAFAKMYKQILPKFLNPRKSGFKLFTKAYLIGSPLQFTN